MPGLVPGPSGKFSCMFSNYTLTKSVLRQESLYPFYRWVTEAERLNDLLKNLSMSLCCHVK